jgi:hypothetical protein
MSELLGQILINRDRVDAFLVKGSISEVYKDRKADIYWYKAIIISTFQGVISDWWLSSEKAKFTSFIWTEEEKQILPTILHPTS